MAQRTPELQSAEVENRNLIHCSVAAVQFPESNLFGCRRFQETNISRPCRNQLSHCLVEVERALGWWLVRIFFSLLKELFELALEDLLVCEGVLSPVLDVGTGSGVLAIAAARLGVRAVVAVDVDPVAIEAAAENVRRNGLEAIVSLRRGSLESVTGRYRLIVANLYAGLLRELFARFADHAGPGDWLIVSGLLEADRDEVRGAALAAGWEPKSDRCLDGWTTLTLRRAI